MVEPDYEEMADTILTAAGTRLVCYQPSEQQEIVAAVQAVYERVVDDALNYEAQIAAGESM